MKATVRIQANKALRQTLASKLDQAAASFESGPGVSACSEPKAKARVKKEKQLKATHSSLNAFCIHPDSIWTLATCLIWRFSVQKKRKRKILTRICKSVLTANIEFQIEHCFISKMWGLQPWLGKHVLLPVIWLLPGSHLRRLISCPPDENCKRNLKTNSFPGHCGGAWCDPHKARAKPQRAISSELPIARYDQQVRLPIFMISSWELIIYLWGFALLSSRTQLWKSAAPLWMRRIRRCRTVHFWCWKSHLISSNIRVKNYIMDRSGMG